MKDPRRAALAAAIAWALAGCAGRPPIGGGSERARIPAPDREAVAALRAIRFPTGDGRDMALDDLRGAWVIAIAAERRSDALGRAWGRLVGEYREARRRAGSPDDLVVLGVADLVDLARILRGIARMEIRREENPAGILIDAEGEWRRVLGYDPTRASIYLFDPEGNFRGELGREADPDAGALEAFLRPYAEAAERPAIYDVRSSRGAEIEIDGRVEEPAWADASIETRFSSPWDGEAVPETAFRALSDGKTLFISFVVRDDDIVLSEDGTGEAIVDLEDRVEIFFARDGGLGAYSCIEIDPRGRVHDYAARSYRIFDAAWNLEGLRAASAAIPGGYAVEAAIPLASLEASGLPARPGALLRAGLYRAEFRRAPDGTIVERWLAWVDPKTPSPDFHVPESFGWLRLAP